MSISMLHTSKDTHTYECKYVFICMYVWMDVFVTDLKWYGASVGRLLSFDIANKIFSTYISNKIPSHFYNVNKNMPDICETRMKWKPTFENK